MVPVEASYKDPFGTDADDTLALRVYKEQSIPPVGSTTLRSVFQATPLPSASEQRDHPHPTGAWARTVGNSFVEAYAAQIGLVPYFYQMSASDQRKGRRGWRTYYWVKDLTAEPRVDPPTATDLVVLTHVDFYVDMRAVLLTAPGVVAVITFTPTTVSGNGVEDCSWWFDEDNRVHITYMGGAPFVHRVWRYDLDHVSVWSGPTNAGVDQSYRSFLIERRRVSVTMSVILFIPVAWHQGENALRASQLFDSCDMDYLRPYWPLRHIKTGEVQHFTRLDVLTPTGVRVSIGKPRFYCSVECSAEQYEQLYHNATLTSFEVSPANAQRVLDAELGANLLTTAVRAHKSSLHPPVAMVIPIAHGLRHYLVANTFDPVMKPTLHVFMSPLFDGSFAPYVNSETEADAVKTRVTDVAAGVLPLTPLLVSYMVEYRDLILQGRSGYAPTTEDEVALRQNRPSQRRIQERGTTGNQRDKTNSEIKRESYCGINNARLITIGPDDVKIAYARFMYVLTDLISLECQHTWYAFHRTPRAVALRVAELCLTARIVVKSDLSRCDGRVSNLLRALERMIMTALFHPDYHQELHRLMDAQFGHKVTTRHGVRYDIGDSRESGSAETSTFNSIACSFIAYTAARNLGMSPERAWASLGVYGGDDGLTADIPYDALAAAASAVGQKMTGGEVVRGDMGVSFLARTYMRDVWYGDPNSCCDFPRTMGKCHLTTRDLPVVGAVVVLVEKFRGLGASDPWTPILGAFSQLVMRLAAQARYPDEDLGNQSSLTYLGRGCEQHEQYPNYACPDMFDYVANSVPGFEPSHFLAWLGTVTCLEDMLSPPAIAPPAAPPSRIPTAIAGYDKASMDAYVPDPPMVVLPPIDLAAPPSLPTSPLVPRGSDPSPPPPAPVVYVPPSVADSLVPVSPQRRTYMSTRSVHPLAASCPAAICSFLTQFSITRDLPGITRTPVVSYPALCYWGQLKLLIADLAFMEAYQHLARTVVVIGSATGEHYAVLARRYPTHRFEMFDDGAMHPAPLSCKNVRHHATRLDATFNPDPAWVGHCLLITDHRTSIARSPSGSELVSDLQLSTVWHELLQPLMASHKLCVPYPRTVPGEHTRFYDGLIFPSYFGPPTSTEVRLFTDGSTSCDWNHLDAERRMFAFNTLHRTHPGLIDHNLSLDHLVLVRLTAIVGPFLEQLSVICDTDLKAKQQASIRITNRKLEDLATGTERPKVPVKKGRGRPHPTPKTSRPGRKPAPGKPPDRG